MGNKGLVIFLFTGAIVIGFLLDLYYKYIMTSLKARSYHDDDMLELLALNGSIRNLVLSN